MKIIPLGTVRIRVLLMLFCALLHCSYASAAVDVQLFRIVGPTSTVITALSADGTITWTNNAVGVTCTVESTSSIGVDGTWARYTELMVTSPVTRLRIFDPNPPAGMILIPAGSFMMGNATNVFSADEGFPVELPQHAVCVKGFYIGQYEVTKGEWDEVYAWAIANGYKFEYSGLGKAANHPVQSIGWYDMVKWCNARSEKEFRTPCYTTNGVIYKTGTNDNVVCNWAAAGYRLPTEAEWEKAARGGQLNMRFSWRDTNDINRARANYYSAWTGGVPNYPYDKATESGNDPAYNDGVDPYTSPVGAFSPNGYGVYDTTGNAYEWCWDWYDASFYAISSGTDPRGPVTGLSRVFRGGSCASNARFCRSSNRGNRPPAEGSDIMSFRLAISL